MVNHGYKRGGDIDLLGERAKNEQADISSPHSSNRSIAKQVSNLTSKKCIAVGTVAYGRMVYSADCPRVVSRHYVYVTTRQVS